MAELQKDPITRGDFLGFGLLGAISGAILTIPPVAFVLSPVIKTNVLGQTDIDQGWQRVGPVADLEPGTPDVFEVEFPIEQVYSDREIQEKFSGSQKSESEFTVRHAVWLSWKAPVKIQGQQGSGGDILGEPEKPAILDQKTSGFTQSERDEILGQLNILSNSCAHLGCPVRWFPEKHEFLCPCHGGLYDINGGYVGGPPPRGMYNYTQAEIREDGTLYIKHGYDIEPGLNKQQPYVV
ncbi:MAG: Rieske 2Fe-2S domain-containing protein [Actinomycetota bacterium]|nr:Rieske 2Fe-2S domain-containing protein [Actinomycetota bacterium]MDQ3375538.1 Rieske 2Fe-2S domain-containing protein [Actinomycetota bacterium]